jgi:zinc protease
MKTSCPHFFPLFLRTLGRTLGTLGLALLVCPPAFAQPAATKTGPQPVKPQSSAPAEVQTGSAEARFGLKFKPEDFKPPLVSHTELANGITLDFYAEPTIPLVTILVRLRVGAVNDPAGKAGAASMAAEVIRNGGSKTVSGDELDRQLENRGAQLSAESNREETWFRLSVLKEDLDWGTKILLDLLTNPALPQAKLDEARGRELVDLRQRLDVPSKVARVVYPQLIYGYGNPWGWTETENTLNSLTLADLKAIVDRFYLPANMKFGLSGDVTWDKAQAVAGETFGKIPKREAPPAKLPPAEPVTQSRVYIVSRPATQNVVYLGHEGVNRFDPQKFPLKVFNNVLSGGFTSRLFKEIRSDRGLAYAVYGQMGEGSQRGIYLNVALTKVASSGETLDLMKKINEDLRRTAPSLREVDLAKQSDINSFVFFFDTAEKIVRQKMTLDGFGYPPDYLATYTDKLKAVTPQEVQVAAEQKLHPDRVIVLVVGQVDPPLRKELEKIGPVTEIKEEELKAKWL